MRVTIVGSSVISAALESVGRLWPGFGPLISLNGLVFNVFNTLKGKMIELIINSIKGRLEF